MNAQLTPPLHPAPSYSNVTVAYEVVPHAPPAPPPHVTYSPSIPTRGGAMGCGMVIGEAPGKTEVREGRPFVGPSGVLLRSALELLEVNYDNLTITNALQYQTLHDGRNVAPSIDSVTSMENLERIEELVVSFQPCAILLLGRTAQNLIGRPNRQWGRSAMTTLGMRGTRVHFAWHPAYVLRERSRNADWLLQLRDFTARCRLADRDGYDSF